MKRKRKDAQQGGRLRVGEQLNRSRGGNVAIFILLGLMALFMGMPLFYSIASAFKPPEEIYLFPPKFYAIHPTINNFKQLSQMVSNLWVPFSRYLYNSLFISVVTTFFSVFIGALAAYPFAKHKFVGRDMLWRLIMVTLLFSGGVTALPSYIIKARLGLINSYWVMILPAIAVPLQMFLMRQFMMQIPDSLLEAARLDGAREFRIFTSVILPNVKPAWLTVMVLQPFRTFGTVPPEALTLLPSSLMRHIKCSRQCSVRFRRAAMPAWVLLPLLLCCSCCRPSWPLLSTRARCFRRWPTPVLRTDRTAPEPLPGDSPLNGFMSQMDNGE